MAGALSFLTRHELGTVTTDGRTRRVALTERGRRARANGRRVLAEVEAQWPARFGPPAVANLDAALGTVLDHPQLAAGLQPHADGWRAHAPYTAITQALLADPVAVLAQYPMVSHRGGYPDGS